MLNKILKCFKKEEPVFTYTLRLGDIMIKESISHCRFSVETLTKHRIIHPQDHYNSGVKKSAFYIYGKCVKFKIIYESITVLSYGFPVAPISDTKPTFDTRCPIVPLNMSANHYYRNDEYIAWVFENNLYLLKYDE